MNLNELLKGASATGSSPLYLFLIAFLAGITISFTPCIYPMIPITAGILQTQANHSAFFNFLSSIAYIFGIALLYAALGYVSATSSILFGAWLGNPYFVVCIVFFFVYMAGTMFGWYELYYPQFLNNKFLANQKGSLLRSFVLGLVSGTVASPCLTPTLAVLLGIVAQHGNPLVGFITLFCFAVGMSLLLLIVGTFSSTISFLPRSGEWMDYVKKLFGFLTLGVCVNFLTPFAPSWAVLGGYAAIGATASGYYVQYIKKSRIALVICVGSVLSTIGIIAFMIRSYF